MSSDATIFLDVSSGATKFSIAVPSDASKKIKMCQVTRLKHSTVVNLLILESEAMTTLGS